MDLSDLNKRIRETKKISNDACILIGSGRAKSIISMIKNNEITETRISKLGLNRNINGSLSLAIISIDSVDIVNEVCLSSGLFNSAFYFGSFDDLPQQIEDLETLGG